jgi:hypothetical protein
MLRKVHGHSMVPVLPPGTLVFGFRWFHKLRPGKVIIFNRENRETVKRIDHIEEDGLLFVLGDHAETSTDSRHYGMIEPSAVASVVIWPRTDKVLAESDGIARRLKRHRTDSSA